MYRRVEEGILKVTANGIHMVRTHNPSREVIHDWNVVVTVAPEGYHDAIRVLRDFGEISRTWFRDVLVMRVEKEAHEFQEMLRELLQNDATLANSVSRLIPVTDKFSYSSAEEFRTKAKEVVRPWANELAGKTFYVRMHRRGFHEVLTSHTEESALGEFLLDCIREDRSDTHVRFENPDFVIAVETVGEDAGLSRWSRADLDRYELLRLD
jgi:tRNA(Ser,Leu) C12 N-acetylase TAN1